MIKQVLISIVFGAAVLTVGILIGHFGITKSGSSAPSWVKDVAKDVDEDFVEKFMSTVDNIQIQENLRWFNEWWNADLLVTQLGFSFCLFIEVIENVSKQLLYLSFTL